MLLCHRQADDGQERGFLCPHLEQSGKDWSPSSDGQGCWLSALPQITLDEAARLQVGWHMKSPTPDPTWAHHLVSSLYPGICRGCWSSPLRWCCPGDAKQCEGSSCWSPNCPRWFHPSYVCRQRTLCGALGPAWACCFPGTLLELHPAFGRGRTSGRSCCMSQSSPHCRGNVRKVWAVSNTTFLPNPIHLASRLEVDYTFVYFHWSSSQNIKLTFSPKTSIFMITFQGIKTEQWEWEKHKIEARPTMQKCLISVAVPLLLRLQDIELPSECNIGHCRDAFIT